VVHIVDVLADPEYTHSEASDRRVQNDAGCSTGARWADGVLTLTRPGVRPFTENQIELITTFADQAVIAIENARLFEGVQARTRELAKTVEDLDRSRSMPLPAYAPTASTCWAINTVLDIAKIESGQFTLNMTEYESPAQHKKLTLTTSVDKSLPVGLGDEQRLTQVLGNAVKFIPTPAR
jgi:signal transduction histidine kinase